MYNGTSQQFNSSIEKLGGRTFKAKLNSDNLNITSQIKSIKYVGGSISENNITIGSAVSAYIEVKAEKLENLVTGQEFKFEIGIDVSQSNYEYCPIGYFKAQKPEKTDFELTFKAYDRMNQLERPYTSNLTYPCTTEQVMNEISSLSGFTFVTDIQLMTLNSPNTDEGSSNTVLAGYTMREVVGYIAGLYGKFAVFNRLGQLEFRWFEDSGYEINVSRCWEFTKNETDYSIDKIIGIAPDDTSYSSGSGISGISYSNPFITQNVVDDIYKKIGGFSYRAANVKFLGDCRLDAWDLVTVYDLFGNSYKVPLMSIEHNLDGGLTTIISAKADQSENVEDKYKGPVTKAMERTHTELLIINQIVANKVSTDYLEANYVKTNELDAVQANIESAVITNIQGKFADIDDLTATNARVEKLESTALTTDSAEIKELDAGVAKINTLIFGSASGTVIQTEFSNSVIAQLGDAQIKSAMIAEIDAGKINSGSIYTNKVHIYGDNSNKLSIIDNTIAISDGIYTRVQIGKDANADYNMYVWDKAGNLMFDALGLTADGITRKVIRDDVVKDNANISASKLNIDSLFTVINADNSHTLKSSKIYLDEQAQSLDVAFKSMTNSVNELQKTQSSQGEQISIIQGQISSKVWQQDITTAVSKLDKDLSADISTLNTQYSTINQTVNGIQSTVGSHTTSINNLDTRVSSAESNITQQSNLISTKVSEDGIISAINQSAETVLVNANKINLAGYLTVSKFNALNIGGRNLIPYDVDPDTIFQGINKDVFSSATINPATGTEYIVSFEGKADSETNIQCFFYHPNTTTRAESSSGNINNRNDGMCYVKLSTQWKKYWVKWTQTHTDSVKWLIVGRNASKDINVYIRKVKLEEGNIPTAFSLPPEAISVDNIYVSGTTTIDGGKLATDSVTADKIKAHSISADKLAIGKGGNLYATGYDTFEQIPNMTDSISAAYGWASISIDNTNAYYGTRCLKYTSTGSSSYIHLYNSSNIGIIPVEPGKTYIISAYVKATTETTDSSRLIYFLNRRQDKTLIRSEGHGFTARTNWERKYWYITVKNDTYHLSLRFDNKVPNTTIWIDAIQIEKGEVGQLPSEFTPAGVTTIDGGNIITGSITSNQIAANSINGDRIAAGTITGDKIATGTVLASNVTAKYMDVVEGTLTTHNSATGGLGVSITDSAIDFYSRNQYNNFAGRLWVDAPNGVSTQQLRLDCDYGDYTAFGYRTTSGGEFYNAIQINEPTANDGRVTVYTPLTVNNSTSINNSLSAGDTTVDYLTIRAGNSDLEGGEINLIGAGGHGDIHIDNYSGDLRFFYPGASPIRFDCYNGTITGGYSFDGGLEGSFTTSGLSPVAGRCYVKAGGYYRVKNMVFVQMELYMNTSLGTEDYWSVITGMPEPRHGLVALAASETSTVAPLTVINAVVRGTTLQVYVGTAIPTSSSKSLIFSGIYLT